MRDACPECGSEIDASNLRRHRRNAHGVSLPPPKNRPAPLLERVLRHSALDPSTGCIEWQGRINLKGYGTIRKGGPAKGDVLAHRAVWTEVRGEPGTLLVCHACDNTRCVNIDHLFLGTNADNMRDMAEKGRAPRGEARTGSVLTADVVASMRARYADGATPTELARDVGVSATTARRAIFGALWAWLPNAQEPRGRGVS